jgi:hypothetical protein
MAPGTPELERERLQSRGDRSIDGAKTMLTRASLSIFLAAVLLLAAQKFAKAQEAGKIGPPLQTVKAFGDDFRLPR